MYEVHVVCLAQFLSLCVGVWAISIHAEARERPWNHLSISPEAGSVIEPETGCSSWVDWQQSWWIPCLHSPSAGVTGLHSHAWLFCVVPRIKFRSSCLQVLLPAKESLQPSKFFSLTHVLNFSLPVVRLFHRQIHIPFSSIKRHRAHHSPSCKLLINTGGEPLYGAGKMGATLPSSEWHVSCGLMSVWHRENSPGWAMSCPHRPCWGVPGPWLESTTSFPFGSCLVLQIEVRVSAVSKIFCLFCFLPCWDGVLLWYLGWSQSFELK